MKIAGVMIATALALIFSARLSVVSANEGQVDLRSLINHPNRCLASSHTNVSNTFSVLVSCRDLNYTPSPQAITYVMWATPANSDQTLLLGPLQFGKAQFTVVPPFVSLFVTIEVNASVKQPTGQVIMRGNVIPYEFLDPTRPTPTINEDEPTPDELEVVTPTPTPNRGITSTLQRGGVVVSIVLLGLLIGFVFVVTRPRR